MDINKLNSHANSLGSQFRSMKPVTGAVDFTAGGLVGGVTFVANDIPKALYIAADGTIDLTFIDDAAGITGLPVFKGTYIFGIVKSIQALSGATVYACL